MNIHQEYAQTERKIILKKSERYIHYTIKRKLKMLSYKDSKRTKGDSGLAEPFSWHLVSQNAFEFDKQ